ncbi:aspartate/glutamate racemase family protein [Lutispora sp.]|uniref:aspartate/glutamate racemase family protein n=1 Tax=Lutispora sp. TaxID=2828727 RepID=UPI002B203F24|nr:aspartate/glutamate racemase family protein [Lutispora sp.]MEA4962960.1 aspartate/glutamate racemase family protein [Lutispora sp.]
MRNIKILNLLPVVYTEGLENETDDRIKLREKIFKDTNNLVILDTVFVEKGFSSIEGSYDVGMSIPYIVEKANWGQENGYNAIILDCFMDPGLDECRETLEIPVFGACQSACSLAIRMGGEFSVIGILDDMDRCIKQNLSKYGMIDRLRSIPVISTEVLNIQYNTAGIIKKVVETSKKIVKEDKAKAIVLGCTGLAPLVDTMQAELKKINIHAPIIEPFRAALYDAISCVLMGVSHSKEAYRPIRKKFNNFNY